MVYTPDIFTNNSTMSPGPYVTTRKPSARKPLRLFTEVLDIKKKTSFRQVCAAKPNHKSIRAGNMLWSSIPTRKGQTKTNKRTKKYIYNRII